METSLEKMDFMEPINMLEKIDILKMIDNGYTGDD